MKDELEITLKNNYHTIVITKPFSDVSLTELMDSMIKPLLLAAGYSPDNVAEYFDEDIPVIPLKDFEVML